MSRTRRIVLPALCALLAALSLAAVWFLMASGRPTYADRRHDGRIVITRPPLSDVAWAVFSEQSTGTPDVFVWDTDARAGAVGSLDPATKEWDLHTLDAKPAYFGPPAQLIRDSSGTLWLGWSDLFGQIDRDSSQLVPVAVPGLEELPPNPTLDDVAKSRPPIQDMKLDALGRVWFTREGGGVWRYDPIPKTLSKVDLPAGLHGGALLFRSSDEMIVSESNPQRDVRSVPQRLASFASDGATRVIELPLGQIAKVGDREGNVYSEAFGSSITGSPVPPSLMRVSGSTADVSAVGLPPGMAPSDEFLTVGMNGDIWYRHDRDLARYVPSTGSTTTYPLPRVQILLHPPAPDGSANLKESPDGFVDATPAFMSTVVDSDGNLWFAMTVSETFVGVAYR